MNESEKREKLAAYAHHAWAGWMEYMFEQCYQMGEETVIPKAFAQRWMRQMTTSYAELPESEKGSDRDEADKMLKIMEVSDG